MTDKDKFQKTFDKLHASPEVLTEVLNMTTNEKVVPIKKKHHLSRIAVAAAALMLTFGSGATAYAMDLGGIQRTVQVWIHGEQTNAIFTVENGAYTLDYVDESGKEVHQGGGGVAFDADGSERALTEEEIWEHIHRPEVDTTDDGKVICYFMDQQMDITDKFDGDVCFLQLNVEGHIEYMTIKRMSDGIRYAMNPHSYVQPEELDY